MKENVAHKPFKDGNILKDLVNGLPENMKPPEGENK